MGTTKGKLKPVTELKRKFRNRFRKIKYTLSRGHEEFTLLNDERKQKEEKSLSTATLAVFVQSAGGVYTETPSLLN